MIAPEWTHQRIVFAIREKGASLSALSIKNGFSRQTLSWSLYRRHPKANRIIAEFLGLNLHDIWPRWYDENGHLTPLTAPQRQMLRQTARAARRAA